MTPIPESLRVCLGWATPHGARVGAATMCTALLEQAVVAGWQSANLDRARPVASVALWSRLLPLERVPRLGIRSGWRAALDRVRRTSQEVGGEVRRDTLCGVSSRYAASLTST